MASTCGHTHQSFRVVSCGKQILMCFECVMEEIQEAEINHAVLVVRELED